MAAKSKIHSLYFNCEEDGCPNFTLHRSGKCIDCRPKLAKKKRKPTGKNAVLED